jgi:hypothetical protein
LCPESLAAITILGAVILEITVYIGFGSILLEKMPEDKRKAELLQYENSLEGLGKMQLELNRIILDEAQKIHVFHTEVLQKI